MPDTCAHCSGPLKATSFHPDGYLSICQDCGQNYEVMYPDDDGDAADQMVLPGTGQLDINRLIPEGEGYPDFGSFS